jgi:hypothetical protein
MKPSIPSNPANAVLEKQANKYNPDTDYFHHAHQTKHHFLYPNRVVLVYRFVG